MKQEIIAGIILCVMGLSLLVVPSGKLWAVTEKWKTKGGQPSESYAVLMKILGAVFTVTGGALMIFG